MGGKLDGASHLARGGGALLLSYVLSSTEQAINKCVWISKSSRDQDVVRNGFGGGVMMRDDTGRKERDIARIGGVGKPGILNKRAAGLERERRKDFRNLGVGGCG